jgi:Cu/Ag efflux pump CusA
MQFSVTDAFISIFGIAVMDDVLLSFCIRALWEEGHPFVESTILGRGGRFRAMMRRPPWDVVIGGCVADQGASVRF